MTEMGGVVAFLLPSSRGNPLSPWQYVLAIRTGTDAFPSYLKIVITDLATLQRMAPLMTAHVRMRSSVHWRKLKEVFDQTEEGPEKREMPDKMAIEPQNLEQASTRVKNLARVRGTYEKDYAAVLAKIEAVSKAAGTAYLRQRTSWGKPTRGRKAWRRQRKSTRVQVWRGITKDAAITAEVERMLSEKN